MTDKDRCPKCKGWYVYSEHKQDKWRIYCQSCGLSTELYDTWKQARIEWDRKEKTNEQSRSIKGTVRDAD